MIPGNLEMSSFDGSGDSSMLPEFWQTAVAPLFDPSEMIPGNLEMYPTQAKKRLEWATNHFVLSKHFIL